MTEAEKRWVDLELALDRLRDADSQDNTKGKWLREWFQKYSGQDAAVSFITENKQIGNRLKEQKGKDARYTVFFFTDPDLVDKAKARISEYVYPNLEAVFFIVWQDRYKLPLVLAKGGRAKGIVSQIIERFGDAPVEELPVPPRDAAEDRAKPAGGRWLPALDLIEEIPADPCGLVGLEGAIAQAVASIRAGKHVILIGPPGTAKSEAAECICNHFEAKFEVAVATADWSTFETIGGYFQVPTGSAGESTIDFLPGIVARAMESHTWLIIDEFNRADMDKAFGELFAVLLGKTVALPYFKKSGEQLLPVSIGGRGYETEGYAISCPDEWRLIATMNSFDKASLSKLSLALMRRFAAVYVDLPNERAYASLLMAQAERHSNDASDTIKEVLGHCASLLIRLFALAENSLRAAELGIGPAIPLDVLSYIRKRLDETLLGAKFEPSELVLQGLEQFLFPQYEGKDDAHEQIVDLLMEVLGDEERRRERTSQILAIYTGFRWSE